MNRRQRWAALPKGKTKRRTTNPPSQREIGGGETSNPPPPPPPPPPPQEEIGGEREIVKIDTDLLDCSICTYPLCPPLYQCENGHVACTSCWSNIQHKCHICKVPVVSRSIALEKILESVHVPCIYAHLGCCKYVSYSQRQVHTDTCEFGPSLCPYAHLGCCKYVSYSQRQVHTDTCEFGPSLCPIPGCAHKAFSGEWRGHFQKNHLTPGTYYFYGHSCTIRFNEEDLYYALLGPGKDLFLLVKEPILNVGYALSLYYIDLPDQGQNVFPYELEVVSCDNCNITCSMQLKSKAVSIKEWKRGEVRGFSSLLLPLGYDLLSTWVHVLINKELDE